MKTFIARCVVASVVVSVIVTTHKFTPRAQNGEAKLGPNNIKQIIAAMTLEEKALLLVGMGINLGVPIPGLPPPPETGAKVPEKVPGAAGRTHAIARLGIPSLTLADGPAGVRILPTRSGQTQTYLATGFPIASLLAASWDTEIVKRVGVATGSEARDYGVDVLLSPAINIQRNPLGGRNFEYYSEDPLLAGRIAASFVKGVQSTGIGTSVKHFAVNSQEFNRMQSNSIINERAMREIYLRGFEIAVTEAQPWSIMSSYNLLNGTYTSQSRELLTTLLREEWGFKGIVMSDWFAGNDTVEQMKAGNDLLMPGFAGQAEAIIAAVNEGRLSKEQLDQNVERLLNGIVLVPGFKGSSYSNQPDLRAHAQIAREAATEGMVLLQNNDAALPIAATGKVALFGNAAYDTFAGGTGSGDVNKKYVISLDQGLAAAGLTLDESLKQQYTTFIAAEKAKRPAVPWFILPPPLPEMSLQSDRISQLATDSNLAVIVVGRNSGEFSDRKLENDFAMAANEIELLKNISQAFHAKGKKVIAVLNVGGPIEIDSWRSRVDGILLAWQPGQEGGHAINDVLTGRVNPSGKLPATFPVSYSDVPSASTFPGKELVGQRPLLTNPFGGKPAEAVYQEGIYVGYRYYNTFGIKPAYDFGHGLSYTTFSYSPVKLSSSTFKEKLTASVSVKNSGRVAGKEVVQLYIAAPNQRSKKPERELRAFAKTRLLRPGESETITFTIAPRDLSSFDTSTSSWLAEAGTYTVNIGASASNIKSTAKFALAKDLVVKKSRKLLAPQVRINELTPP